MLIYLAYKTNNISNLLYKMSEAKEIQLDVTTHREVKVVLIKFIRDNLLEDAVRKINGAKWSKTHTSWYTPYSVKVLNQIKSLFDPISKINADLLKEKVLNQSANQAYTPISAGFLLSEEAQLKMKNYQSWLQSRRYSPNTIKTYMDALKAFLKFYSDKAVDTITNDDVIKFNNEFILKHKLSASYQSQVVNAIKLFFKVIQSQAINVDEIHRPKKPFKLPSVLSLNEVERILNSLDNIKHKTMLALIYSAGLRRSELLNLIVKDVDSSRMLLTIKSAKGNRDRIVPLSETILVLLRDYYLKYKPKKYLFEGQKGDRYSEGSLQEIFQMAKSRAKINKIATLHSLRHSYATHLLEGGTNLRYIQEILGHKSPKTTQIYTHVSTEGISRITSPIEKLKLNHAK